jgi:LacI family transcriptional regulator
VNAETRVRILRIAADLGYAPDRIASGLRRKRTGIVGFIGDNVATTPFAGQLIAGARAVGREYDTLVLVAESGTDVDDDETLIARLSEQRVDGLLIARMYHQRVRKQRIPTGVPAVVLDGAPEPGWPIDYVVPDEAQIATLACERLLWEGHRDFAYVNTDDDDSLAAHERLSGVRSTLQQAGVAVPPGRVLRVASTAAGGRAAGSALFETADPPTAIICFNDQIAMGILQSAARHGWDVPREVSVIGIDNLQNVADSVDPGLTTVALPHFDMGCWAMKRLMARIDKSYDDAPGEHYRMPGMLVERGTVAPPRQ